MSFVFFVANLVMHVIATFTLAIFPSIGLPFLSVAYRNAIDVGSTKTGLPASVLKTHEFSAGGLLRYSFQFDVLNSFTFRDFDEC